MTVCAREAVRRNSKSFADPVGQRCISTDVFSDNVRPGTCSTVSRIIGYGFALPRRRRTHVFPQPRVETIRGA